MAKKQQNKKAASRKKARKKAGAGAKPASLTVKAKLHGSLLDKFMAQGKALDISPEYNAALMIDNGVAPQQLTDDKKRHATVRQLAGLIQELPAVRKGVSFSEPDQAFWWVKFGIDTDHPLAWHVIQRLGFVLNYYSLEWRFQTTFGPVSPPPYLNGGPKEYLNWVIEAKLRYVDPKPVLKALRAELPKQLGSEKQWRAYDNE